MKNQIEVKLEECNQNETTTKHIVTTDGYDTWFIIDRVTEFVKMNFRTDSSMTISVNSIHDPSMIEPLTSQLGHSLIEYVPFVIELGDEVTEPKDYDSIWV